MTIAHEIKTLEVFENFLIKYEGFDPVESGTEVEIFINMGVTPKTPEKEVIEAYKKATRKGTTRRLSRRDRINIAMLYCNAANHASVEVYGE